MVHSSQFQPSIMAESIVTSFTCFSLASTCWNKLASDCRWSKRSWAAPSRRQPATPPPWRTATSELPANETVHTAAQDKYHQCMRHSALVPLCQTGQDTQREQRKAWKWRKSQACLAPRWCGQHGWSVQRKQVEFKSGRCLRCGCAWTWRVLLVRLCRTMRNFCSWLNATGMMVRLFLSAWSRWIVTSDIWKEEGLWYGASW